MSNIFITAEQILLVLVITLGVLLVYYLFIANDDDKK